MTGDGEVGEPGLARSQAAGGGTPEGGRLRCLTCGAVLGVDDEDEPTGDAGGPICGECNRARNFDVLFER